MMAMPAGLGDRKSPVFRILRTATQTDGNIEAEPARKSMSGLIHYTETRVDRFSTPRQSPYLSNRAFPAFWPIPAVLMRPTGSLPLSSEGAPLVLRHQRYHLRPMCLGHAPDNGRHVEIQLSYVGVFPGHWPVVAIGGRLFEPVFSSCRSLTKRCNPPNLWTVPKRSQQVTRASGKAVELPDQDTVDLMVPGGHHQGIEPRAALSPA